MKLSLCMIVKDEAKHIKECILSVKSVVDEVVVVDTGSTDGTKEIARELGAKVFDFPWCDDFSAARNESIRHATGDYILWFDADDRMDRSEVDKMRHLKGIFPLEKNKAYYLIISSPSPLEGESCFLQLRIFPKIEGAFFEGKIHEQIYHNLAKRGVELVQTDVVIRHTGYSDKEVILQKAKRNLEIIENGLESDPENLHLHFNAARTLSGMGRLMEAVSHLEKITQNEEVREKEKPLLLHANQLLGQYYLQMKLYDKAQSLFQELLEELGEGGLVLYYLGKTFFLGGNYQKGAETLRQSLRIPLQVSTLPVNLDEIRYDQHYLLGQCYIEMGETERAKEIYLKSLELHPNHPKSLEALGLLSLKDQSFEEAITFYKKAIEQGGGSDQNYSNLGLAYRKLGLWREAEQSLTKALEMNPQRIEALTNLGYLYYEMEEGLKALPFFTQALNIDPYLPDVRLTLSEIYFLQYDLDSLVEQCDELLKALDLPRNICLESFKDLSDLYEKIGESYSEKGRRALSLMAYHLSFLIHPSRAMLDRILSIAKGSGVFEPTLRKIEKALAFHQQQGQQIASREEIFGQA